MGQLDGKTAIVTGGGTGIGKGIARAFANEGCNVVIASRSADALGQAAKDLGQIGPDIVSIPTNVTNEAQVASLFNQTMSQFGRLDVLVNNSGAFDGGPIDTLTLEAWDKVISTNVTGPFLCSREAFRIMKKSGGGRIINIGSISAQMPRQDSAPYSTSKFALTGLTKSLALDGREFGIACSILHPGNTAVERRSDSRSGAGRDMGPEVLIATEDMARTALLMATMPPDTNLFEAIVLPVQQPYLGRG